MYGVVVKLIIIIEEAMLLIPGGNCPGYDGNYDKTR